MKHVHHPGLTETPAVGQRILCRQADEDGGEVTATMFGVVVPLDSISPLKVADCKAKGFEPHYVVRWDRATWASFDEENLDLVSCKGGQCIELDANEEYATCPTPEFNARKALDMMIAETTKAIAGHNNEDPSRKWLEGTTEAVWGAEKIMQSVACQFGINDTLGRMGGGQHSGNILGRLLNMAAKYYAETVRLGQN